MSSTANLTDKARTFEQREQWTSALEVYESMVAGAQAGEDLDVGLWNRIGDLHIRLGQSERAVTAYEKAVEAYREAGLHNNAIALCNKILRISPGRPAIALKLALISAAKGFVADAQGHLRTYLERMSAGNQLEKAVDRMVDSAISCAHEIEVFDFLASQLRAQIGENLAADRLAPAHQRLLGEGLVDEAEQVQAILAAGAASKRAPEPRAAAPRPGGAARQPEEAATDEPSMALLDFEPLTQPQPGADAGRLPDLTVASAPPPAGADLLEIQSLDGLQTTSLDETRRPAADGSWLLDIEIASEDEPDAGAGDAGDDEDGDGTGEAAGEPLPLITFGAVAPVDEDDETGEVDYADEDDEDDGDDGGLVLIHPTGYDDEEEEPGDRLELLVPLGFDGALDAADGREDEEEDVDADEDESAGAGDLPLISFDTLAAVLPVDEAPASEPVELEPAGAPVAESEPEDDLHAGELPTFEDPAAEPARKKRTARRDSRAETAQPAPAAPAPEPEPVAEPAAEPLAAAAPVAEEAPPVETPEYIDLGSLVFDDEEPATTRFVVEAEEPTGDEDRDLADILSRFREQISKKIDVDDDSSHYDLGVAFKEMGLYDEAISEFQTALRAGSNPLATMEMLGVCFIDKGQHAVAWRVLDQAIRFSEAGDPDLVGVFYWIGRCDEELGREDAARDSYERVLSVDIRFRDAADRLSALRV
jgi:tetratricopeptide (TPR) repeat protein